VVRVFVSHASVDRALADQLHRWLVEAGHRVFLALDLRDGIVLGEEWERRLHEELRRADAVVCVVTSAFLASRWCTAEIAIARARGIRLLPLQAEVGVTDPLLKSIHHSDLRGASDTVRTALIDALRQVDATSWNARSLFRKWWHRAHGVALVITLIGLFAAVLSVPFILDWATDNRDGSAVPESDGIPRAGGLPMDTSTPALPSTILSDQQLSPCSNRQVEPFGRGTVEGLDPKEGYDLDCGVKATPEEAPGLDISGRSKEPVIDSLAIPEGGRLARLPSNPGMHLKLDCERLADGAWMKNVVGNDNLGNGQDICVRTSEGNVAIITLTRPWTTQRPELYFTYRVWYK
jgi:TIR domain